MWKVFTLAIKLGAYLSIKHGDELTILYIHLLLSNHSICESSYSNLKYLNSLYSLFSNYGYSVWMVVDILYDHLCLRMYVSTVSFTKIKEGNITLHMPTQQDSSCMCTCSHALTYTL